MGVSWWVGLGEGGREGGGVVDEPPWTQNIWSLMTTLRVR